MTINLIYKNVYATEINIQLICWNNQIKLPSEVRRSVNKLCYYTSWLSFSMVEKYKMVHSVCFFRLRFV